MLIVEENHVRETGMQNPQQPNESSVHDTSPRRPTGAFRLEDAPRYTKNERSWCLPIVGLILVFACVAGCGATVFFAYAAKPIYQDMEPLDQEIWCNRAENVPGLGDEVCSWKPTPPFEVYPTIEGDSEIDPNDLLLTPFDFGDSSDNGGTDLGQATPVSANSTVQSPPVMPTFTPSLMPAITENVLTAVPTATPLPSSTPVPVIPTATATPLPTTAKLNLSLLRSESQKWNNCGPTTLTMGLSYFGYSQNQDLAASYLKPNIEDKNVSPWQMINFVNTTATNMIGTQAIYRIGGDLDLLKTLVANNFPVIIEKGYEVNNLGWMGHYLLIVGYDEPRQIFYTFDSYLGTNRNQGREETYEYVERNWRHFNHTFIVLYTPDREQQLATLIGGYANPTTATQIALEQAQADAVTDPNDKWAWVNMGEAFAKLGQYAEAASAFDRAFQLGLPYRLLWYQFGAFDAYYQMGRYDDVIRLANSVDQSSGYYVEEAWYYRGLAYAAKGDQQRAINDFQRVLNFNHNYTPAQEALSAVQSGAFSVPSAG